jgi:glycosyltransferase involved in cell wall biosynthesis
VNPPRLVLVTRRFWPLVGGAEAMMANLAIGFRERGAPTTILTARWQSEWPATVEHHGVHVERLPQPSTRWLGTWRYMRALTQRLQARHEEHDLVYVSMLKHDAYAAIGATRRSRLPVVLRAEGAGATGDVHWQLEANFGRRIKRRSMRAAALVAPSPAIERELIAAGYSRDRIHYIPNGVPIPPPRDPAARDKVRGWLARSQPALYVHPGARLAVYTGRLHETKGLAHLIEAWYAVVRHDPTARLWLVGEGPERPKLVALIRELELNGSVVLTGAFDQVDDLLAAADLFVLPSLEEGMSLALLEAMAAGLPIVASDIPGARGAGRGDPAHARLARGSRSHERGGSRSRDDRVLARALRESSLGTLRASHRGAHEDGVTERIVHIIPTLVRGGAEKQLVLLARGLARQAYDVQVITLTAAGPLSADLAEASIPITAIDKRWKLDPAAFSRLTRELRRLKPALVHTWLVWPRRGTAGWRAAYRGGRTLRRPVEGLARTGHRPLPGASHRSCDRQLQRRARLLRRERDCRGKVRRDSQWRALGAGQ